MLDPHARPSTGSRSVPPGKWLLRIESPGLVPFERDDRGRDGAAGVDVVLEEGLAVFGTVSRRQGCPAGRSSGLFFEKSDGNPASVAKIAADGSYRAAGLTPGTLLHRGDLSQRRALGQGARGDAAAPDHARCRESRRFTATSRSSAAAGSASACSRSSEAEGHSIPQRGRRFRSSSVRGARSDPGSAGMGARSPCPRGLSRPPVVGRGRDRRGRSAVVDGTPAKVSWSRRETGPGAAARTRRPKQAGPRFARTRTALHLCPPRDVWSAHAHELPLSSHRRLADRDARRAHRTRRGAGPRGAAEDGGARHQDRERAEGRGRHPWRATRSRTRACRATSCAGWSTSCGSRPRPSSCWPATTIRSCRRESSTTSRGMTRGGR